MSHLNLNWNGLQDGVAKTTSSSSEDQGVRKRQNMRLKKHPVCVCVNAYWLKGGVVMGVAYGKRHITSKWIHMTCTRFRGKVGHEPKDSSLFLWTDWEKKGCGSGNGL